MTSDTGQPVPLDEACADMFMGRIREIASVDGFDGTHVRIRAPESGPTALRWGLPLVEVPDLKAWL